MDSISTPAQVSIDLTAQGKGEGGREGEWEGGRERGREGGEGGNSRKHSYSKDCHTIQKLNTLQTELC